MMLIEIYMILPYKIDTLKQFETARTLFCLIVDVDGKSLYTIKRYSDTINYDKREGSSFT